MSEPTVISVDIDLNVKEQADLIFQQLGLTTSEAITLFYRQVVLMQSLPFPFEVPNGTTKAAKE